MTLPIRSFFTAGALLALITACSSSSLNDPGTVGGANAGSAGASGSTSSAGSAGMSGTAGTAGAAGSAGTAGSPACLGLKEPSAGNHCVCPGDCDSLETCIDEASTGFPGGLCARSCDSGCPTGTICIEATPGDKTTSTCVLSCQNPTDCPAGLVCQNQTAGGPLFCFPMCQSDSDCPTLGTCDRYTGVCGPPTSDAGAGDIGATCQTDADCQSSFCIADPLAPSGYCTAFCSLSRDGCPTGSSCTANWSATGDEGICYKRCSSVSDCRSGYVCTSYPSDPTVKVCAPPAM